MREETQKRGEGERKESLHSLVGRVGENLGTRLELAMTSHKFSFPSRKPRDAAKRENCHRKRAEDQKSDNRLSCLDSGGRVEFIYLSLSQQLSTASKHCRSLARSRAACFARLIILGELARRLT